MKHRNGFVSNSSSASFVINKAYITDTQIDLLKNYRFVFDKFFGKKCSECWDIYESSEAINGFTIMDNHELKKLMRVIGIDTSKITWSE
jgi:hypothetical protein